MACDKYALCDYCSKNSNCPYDFMGDGTPWCREFECTVDDCKLECISFDEMLDELT